MPIVKERVMTLRVLHRVFAVVLLLIGGWASTSSPKAWGQEETTRKIKARVEPVYSDLARRMKITGTVKVRVIVAANGSVKTASLIGGHPVLANAALDAVKRWHFEAAPQESTEIVEFRFDPGQ
ncbi:MAG: energy transducer TonB [Terriglobales bacterium]|jgi:TonB family protein